MAALRGECLKRDRHRCVISGRFDDAEALKRVEREGDDEAKDDDGHKLKSEAGTFTPLKVAHILPHSLMNVGGGGAELVCVASRPRFGYYSPLPTGACWGLLGPAGA